MNKNNKKNGQQCAIHDVSKRYFLIRRYNCGTYNPQTQKMDTDIIGITTDEEYAKSRQSVFCGYEEVWMLS